MNGKSADLARRRQSLIERSARQRGGLAQSYRELQASLSPLRALFGLIKTLKAHPTLVMAIATLVLGARRGKPDTTSKRPGLGQGILRLLQALRLAPRI